MKDIIGRENRTLKDIQCPECGKTFRPRSSKSKYCSRECMWKNNGGHNAKEESWWVGSKGYIEGRVTINGEKVYRKQHRWIMEKHLRCKIPKGYDVHHKNGDKQDNRIENLEVIKTGCHSTMTNKGRIYARGYKLCLTKEQRMARSERAKKQRLWEIGNTVRYAK